MSKLKDIKAMRAGDTIVLHYNGETVNVQKASRLADFKRVEKLIEAGDIDGLIEAFVDIKKAIEGYTKEKMTVENGQLKDKKTGEIIPPAIAKKLMEMKREGVDFMPLWRFWMKLKQNPSKNSVKQLYGFITHNKIPITELGDIVVEKGVKMNNDGTLVDCHTGKFDNSIGMIVEMPREKVEDNPQKTCSAGLHVAAPAYVKEVYSTSVVVECIVNPRDVVSVPVDYNNTKMRVCRYQVVALAKKSSVEKLVVKMEDLVSLPPVAERRENPSEVEHVGSTLKDLMKLTAKAIIDHVKRLTGVDMGDVNLKNKQGIAKKAEKIIHEHGKGEHAVSADTAKVMKKEGKKEIVITGKKCNEVIEEVGKVLGVKQAEEMAGSDPRRGRFIAKVTPILKERGYILVD